MGLVSSVFPQPNEMALVSPLMLCLPELQSQCQHFSLFCGPSLPCSASTALRSVQTVLLSEGGLLFLFLFFFFFFFFPFPILLLLCPGWWLLHNPSDITPASPSAPAPLSLTLLLP